MAFTICFEGVDGSGKTTQIEMLFSKLLKMSRSASIRSYPVYESFFGKELGELLSGTNRQFTASDLDPKSMALWYALDRWLDYQENIRLFKNEYPQTVWLGVSSQSPMGEGNTTRFEEVALTDTNIADFRQGV